MIEKNPPSLSVGAQCRLLSISRSSFYYELMGETAMNLDLMVVIDKQFFETPFYGVQQMTWHLQNEGHAVNYKRIRRLMRLMRLMPIYQKPDTSKPAKGHKTDRVKRIGTRISMDGKRRCLDNIFIERLWRSLKYECAYLHARETGSQARVGIRRWITFYNHQHPLPMAVNRPPWSTSTPSKPISRCRL
jgi:transposase InsO family protein